MAISVRQHDPVRDGTLEIEEHHPNFVCVYFVPPEWSLQAARLDPKQARAHRTKLLDINGQDRMVREIRKGNGHALNPCCYSKVFHHSGKAFLPQDVSCESPDGATVLSLTGPCGAANMARRQAAQKVTPSVIPPPLL